MEDPTLILELRPISVRAASAFQLEHNRKRYLPSSYASQDVLAADEDTRESTPSVCSERTDNGRTCSRLRLTFEVKPKDIQGGFVFGSDPNVCDILLGQRTDGISRQHFNIQFGAGGEVLTLNDTSKHGTTVWYNGNRKDQPRTHFTWILFRDCTIEVQIGPGEEFQFEVKLATHVLCKEEYQYHLASYLKEAGNAIGPLGLLDIRSQDSTAAPTKPSGLTDNAIYRKVEKLGSGEFGTVYKALDVSTGHVYAAKVFRRGHWQQEVEVLSGLSHEHIVRFEDYTSEIEPMLVLEYLPLGNLADQHLMMQITEEETVAILHQCLQALVYVHHEEIAHRDIKPTNILVRSRTPLHVKLGDFGLAKKVSSLKTRCGTSIYMAPEIWNGRPYTAAVDVWALGVVAFEYAYGLPEMKRRFRPEQWYSKLIRSVEDWDSDKLIDFLANGMLKIKAHNRLSASDCLKEVSALRRETITVEGAAHPTTDSEEAETVGINGSPSCTSSRPSCKIRKASPATRGNSSNFQRKRLFEEPDHSSTSRRKNQEPRGTTSQGGTESGSVGRTRNQPSKPSKHAASAPEGRGKG
ncbi:MAG: hypothetical protein M1816_005928 [Peltula sp. TS41687]|nr:MAG: hypothetical protein M1816_005928 [Peltula sp. TS41687]